MELSFTKMHGLGNDFIVLDGIRNPLQLRPEQIRIMADRRLGIGCDQVLLLEPGPGPAAHALFRIFNADGGEVEQCGNGARCVAEFLRKHGYVDADEVKLASKGGPISVFAEGGSVYRVNMGEPGFEPADFPMRVERRRDRYVLKLASGAAEFSAVSMGNPHAILRVDDVEKAPVGELGMAIQTHGMFPEGVNVGFMQVLDPGHILLRVNERGAGETLACGSGACAAVVAGRLQHGLAEHVDVGLKGGHLAVSWRGMGEPVWMAGPATTVFEGSIRL